MVFIYDGYVGGIGIVEGGFVKLFEFFDCVGDLIIGCLCEFGCLLCIYLLKCGNGNWLFDKVGVVYFVEFLCGCKEFDYLVVELCFDFDVWVILEGLVVEEEELY